MTGDLLPQRPMRPEAAAIAQPIQSLDIAVLNLMEIRSLAQGLLLPYDVDGS